MPRYRIEPDGSRYWFNPESGEWVLIEGPARESEDTIADTPEADEEES
jgi:hypothetical protein